jgi:hypothetical protein
MSKAEYLPPLPKKASNQINNFNLAVLTSAALIAGPAPQDAPIRSKKYLERLDEARILVLEYLTRTLKTMTDGQVVIDPKYSSFS